MPDAHGSLSEVVVAGHACDIFEPSSGSTGRIAAIYLHAADESRLCDKPELTALCHRYRLPVIAPRTGRSWWSDRICPEFDDKRTTEEYLLESVLPFMKTRWSEAPLRIGLFGTEMGGQGALRFAYKHPQTFPVVAAVSPAIDYQVLFDEDVQLQSMYRDREAGRQDTALLHVHPLNWPRHQFFCCAPDDYPWWDSADRLHMKLASTGIPHECVLEIKAGSRDEYERLMMERAVTFLVERLERVPL